MQRDADFLAASAEKLLAGCRITASDGTILYTPDGQGEYRALWTRDFAYMVENTGDLLPLANIESALRYILSRPRSDGSIPDRVQPDGVAVYEAGPAGRPLGEANLDNPCFVVIAVDVFLERADGRRAACLKEWLPVLDRGMDFIPRSENGLVSNDPGRPHSPYGFTDCVGKTGELFMESLLYWTACRRLAKWHRGAGSATRAAEYSGRADLIEENAGRCFQPDKGAFVAATVDCRQIDIWGNIYALYLNFPLGARRSAVLNFLVANYDRYVWRGQIRHLLAGEYWERLLAPIERENYQNGAYWATASGWLALVLADSHPALARRLLGDLIADFRQEGICECISPGNRKLEGYVVSATNPLAAVRSICR